MPQGDGLTPAGQSLVLGPGPRSVAIRGVLYSDFDNTYARTPDSLYNLPDAVALQLRYLDRIGWNWVYDRWGGQFYPDNVAIPEWQTKAMTDLQKWFVTDAGVPPEKTQVAAFADQLLAGESAAGIRRMIGLLNMDAGLPLGSGFDQRKPEEMDKTLTELASRFKPYPAFAGFSWGSLWWMFDGGYKDEYQAAAFKAAQDDARKTGRWHPIFETVGQQRFDVQLKAWERFNTTLRGIKREAVTCTAPPFKNYTSYPPITLSNVDEIDLHQQFEQMSVPYHGPLMVDYYKRPGKSAWSHPELGNGMGTGDHTLPWLFLCLARGADGIGAQGRVPGWGYFETDPREARAGCLTAYMRFNQILRAYGPWLQSLEPDDRVAMAVSRRQCLLTNWNNAVGSEYFNSLTEAYITCLHAHHPVRFVFTEDLGKDGFKPFKAVLVVNQWVEPEPELVRALDEARAAGVAVFHDATCRSEFVKGFTPLGFGFDNLIRDISHAGDDAAFWRFPQYARRNLKALKRALDAVTPPAADTDNDEVFFTSRRSGKGRYLFAINNSMIDIDPGYMYRVSLYTAHRAPVKAPVKLSGAVGTVYDVFAQQPAATANGAIEADLRVMPARIFAVLPTAIDRIDLKGPKSMSAGQALAWGVRVLDAAGKPIAASVPVAVRIVGPQGDVIAEEFTAAGPAGAVGQTRLPVNLSAGTYRLEASELLSHKGAALAVAVKAAALPIEPARTADEPVAPDATAQAQAGYFAPVAEGFGARARDVVVTDNGRLAVINTFNWDQNVYGVDVRTGAVRFRQRVGNYFAFSPQPLSDGFAVQGYDLHAPEGCPPRTACRTPRSIRTAWPIRSGAPSSAWRSSPAPIRGWRKWCCTARWFPKVASPGNETERRNSKLSDCTRERLFPGMCSGRSPFDNFMVHKGLCRFVAYAWPHLAEMAALMSLSSGQTGRFPWRSRSSSFSANCPKYTRS